MDIMYNDNMLSVGRIGLRRGAKPVFWLGVCLLAACWWLLAKGIQFFDGRAGLLDVGTLTLFIFGLLLGWVAVYASVWLQELLWKPFKMFRQQFNIHFNQLTSWQKCVVYFSVFFLLLYAVLAALKVVF
ncbi:hypothetical protein ORI89_14040 [Sphingobacterium sp. UT-1RO-CII-1]|uniref:hypothetical protein n=1 Tax=Sphingobacterium sp. UT-1RO-CII-1 TaxID=2995225 RepID=UPI00227AE705|nr:hypothetical protein [Sphingobacterium sp. UT-1RO-CII-1]MCY4780775.1 hypothetical protein [Sphingobacterium sp. UT-1RO-CII-1]